MPEPITCPECGSCLPVDAPRGLCPACLLRAAVGEDTDAGCDTTLDAAASTEPAADDQGPARPGRTRASGGGGGSRDPSVSPSPAVRVRYFGDYELLDEIGRGGMGVVYQARQVEPQPARRPEDDPRRRARGDEDDVRGSAARPRRSPSSTIPHIVPIYEVGEHDGRHYFSMKLVEGGSLAEQLGRLRGRPRGRGPPGRDGRPGRPPRPPAGRPAPRPEAGEHPARRRAAAARHRLRPGQADRGRRPS